MDRMSAVEEKRWSTERQLWAQTGRMRNDGFGQSKYQSGHSFCIGVLAALAPFQSFPGCTGLLKTGRSAWCENQII